MGIKFTVADRGDILMSKLLAALLAGIAMIGSVPVTANAATIDIGSADLTGGASFIANGARIKFDPNASAETATFTLPSIPGTQYIISITGQANQSSSFGTFLIDADGPDSSGAGFVQLGSNVTFGPGFTTTTFTFTNLGTSDLFRIVNGGTGNSEVQISAISITPVGTPTPTAAAPGPIVGAGLPGLVALGGFGLLLLGRRRRRRSLAHWD